MTRALLEAQYQGTRGMHGREILTLQYQTLEFLPSHNKIRWA